MPIAYEQQWPAVSAQAFTSNGTAGGLVTVASTEGFFALQQVTLKGTALNNLAAVVLEVISRTQLYVGLPEATGRARYRARGADVSAYTTAASSTIEAAQQTCVKPFPNTVPVVTFEAEPVTAQRVVRVDRLGQKLPNRVGFERASVAFGAITNAAVTALTTAEDTALLSLHNTTDVELMVTRGGADYKVLPAGVFLELDFAADEIAVASGTAWGVYFTAGPPALVGSRFEIVSHPVR